MSEYEFVGFPKIARLSREVIVTEKIDGTNAQVFIDDTRTEIWAASRARWITVEDDNFGFARWVRDNTEDLFRLGPGRHFGEWWGSGIQRGYGLKERRFSLFNTSRWNDENRPACCHVVPVLYQGLFDTDEISWCLEKLKTHGSSAAQGFMKPEGIIAYHVAAGVGFKKTLEKDEEPKSKVG